MSEEMSECPEKDNEVMHQVNIALTFMVAANGLRKYEQEGSGK